VQPQGRKKSGVDVVFRGPAWLDLLQGISGLLLVVFMWAHMFFVSSILLGVDAMYAVARMFEGEFIFGRPYPILVTAAAAGVLLLFTVHALIAIRKIPASYQEYRHFLRHASVFRHGDTNLWLVQVVSGLLLMLLAFAHLYQMMVHPADIGPYASADRVWSGRWWPFYLILLIAVEIHGGIGLYRLVLKWGWVNTAGGAIGRKKLQQVKWAITGFFLVLGLLTLVAYMKIGFDHHDNVGERYLPAQYQGK
jgi:fumarate reductase subunit C